MNIELLRKQCIGFINTPALWQNQQFDIQQFAFPEIDINPFQPKAIPPKIRLGHQIEHLFKQLIEHDANYEVLLYNLPIRRDKRTIGEIDFILNDKKTLELIHVELTYKFYIIYSEISEPIRQLMGPNKRDTFFAKMEKITNQQFPLLHSPEGISTLSNKEIDIAKIRHQACFKAQLFKPYGSKDAHIHPLNKNCIVGEWLRFPDFDVEEFKKYRFYIPYKAEWVIAPHIDVPWSSHFDILTDIKLRLLKERAPMVWMKKSENEFLKFFVVWW